MATSKPAQAKQQSSLFRTPMQSVVVSRDGQSVVPTIGVPFEFTADEITQIESMNPGAISKKIELDANDPAAVAALSGDSKSNTEL